MEIVEWKARVGERRRLRERGGYGKLWVRGRREKCKRHDVGRWRNVSVRSDEPRFSTITPLNLLLPSTS